MKCKLIIFRSVLLLTTFSISAIVMSATPTIEGTNKNITSDKLVGTKSVNSSAVVDSTKCPERIPDGGAGNYVGGKCIYGMPASGKCADLGSDCSATQDTPPSCRCDSKAVVGGGGGNPGQILSPTE